MVDTQDTTKNGTITQEVDTVDTTNNLGEWTQEQQKEYISSMLKRKQVETTHEVDTEPEEESEEEAQEREIKQPETDEEEIEETDEEEIEETDEEEIEETDEEENSNIITIEVEGKTESFDISVPEERDKLIQFAGKGRYLEKERQKDIEEKKVLENEKKEIENQAMSLSYQMLYLLNEGKLDNQNFVEKPYDDFIGEGEDEEEDKRLWIEHNSKVRKNLQSLHDFSQKRKDTTKKFNDTVEKFKKEHPEIEDVNKWITENLTPYHLPIVTYGAVEYPEDVLEMLYFWKNRDKYEKQKLREHLKKNPIKKKTPITSERRSLVTNNAVQDMIKGIFNPNNLKLNR